MRFAVSIAPRLPAHVVTTVLGRNSRDSYDFQRHLVLLICDKGGLEAFEPRWTKASQSRREEALLTGLVDTCTAFRDCEIARQYCPDLTMKRLAADGGALFAQYLRRIVSKLQPTLLSSAYTKPIHVPHGPVDARYSAWVKSCLELAQPVRTFRVQRTKFLSALLWHTYVTFVRLQLPNKATYC